MEITYHISWKKNSSPGRGCPEADGRLVTTGEGRIMCQYGCSGMIALLHFRCTRVSVQDNWVLGVYSLIHNFSSSNTRDSITVGTTGCCFRGGGNWNVSTTFSLSRRNATNMINSTPRTSVDPVIHVQAGCTHRIVLPVHDPDGDIVRCRWASGKECSGICDKIPGAVLDPNTCTVTYQADKGTGSKVVAIMMEDFIPNSSQALSSVTVQFLVQVMSHTRSCMPGMCV